MSSVKPIDTKSISTKSISTKIAQIYLIGATLLLVFYSLTFTEVILQTENNSSEQRLLLVAPFHFNQFSQGATGIIKIDPLVSIYDDFNSLPMVFQRRLPPDWQGNVRFHFDDDSEFNVVATTIDTPTGRKIAYAIEDIDAIEWDDNSFALFEIAFFIVGFILFLITAGFIMTLAKRIGLPFEQLAKQLEQDSGTNFSPISLNGELTLELVKTLTEINHYRQRISQALDREQAFTRYISHEFRTPMTVIRGSLSILRRQEDAKVQKQIIRIDQAVTEMEQLTHTFLLIAREDNSEISPIVISADFIEQCVENLTKRINANGITFTVEPIEDFKLRTQPQLFKAIIQNLCLNAINCSVDGTVLLSVSQQGIRVIDNGVGLTAKPRGYEGFGIGLNLVRDICDKYQWQFDLFDNNAAGCTAVVEFKFH